MVRYSSKTLISAVLAIGLGVSLTGGAEAITSDTFSYPAMRVGYYSMSAAAFTPETQDLKYSKLAGLDPYLQSLSDQPADKNACFNAAVNLPEGATIFAVVYWYNNNPTFSSAPPAFGLFRQSLNDGSNEILAALGSDPGFTGRTYKYGATTRTVVTNISHTFAAKICLGWADIFYGARITYGFTEAGD